MGWEEAANPVHKEASMCPAHSKDYGSQGPSTQSNRRELVHGSCFSAAQEAVRYSELLSLIYSVFTLFSLAATPHFPTSKPHANFTWLTFIHSLV